MTLLNLIVLQVTLAIYTVWMSKNEQEHPALAALRLALKKHYELETHPGKTMTAIERTNMEMKLRGL